MNEAQDQKTHWAVTLLVNDVYHDDQHLICYQMLNRMRTHHNKRHEAECREDQTLIHGLAAPGGTKDRDQGTPPIGGNSTYNGSCVRYDSDLNHSADSPYGSFTYDGGMHRPAP